MKPHWSIGSILRFSFAGLLLATFVLPSVRGAAGSRKQYLIRCQITHLIDGKTATIANPKLQVVAGEEGSFLAGGMLKTALDASAETIEFGEQVRATVSDLGDGNVRFSARLAESAPVKHDGPGVMVGESSMRIVRDIKLGDAVDLKLENGTAVHIVVTEATPGATAK